MRELVGEKKSVAALESWVTADQVGLDSAHGNYVRAMYVYMACCTDLKAIHYLEFRSVPRVALRSKQVFLW